MQLGIDGNKVIYLTKEYIQKAPEGIAMDELELTNACTVGVIS